MKNLIGQYESNKETYKIYKEDADEKYYKAGANGVFEPCELDLLTSSLAHPWDHLLIQNNEDKGEAEVISNVYDGIKLTVFGKADEKTSAIENCLENIVGIFADKIKEIKEE